MSPNVTQGLYSPEQVGDPNEAGSEFNRLGLIRDILQAWNPAGGEFDRLGGYINSLQGQYPNLATGGTSPNETSLGRAGGDAPNNADLSGGGGLASFGKSLLPILEGVVSGMRGDPYGPVNQKMNQMKMALALEGAKQNAKKAKLEHELLELHIKQATQQEQLMNSPAGDIFKQETKQVPLPEYQPGEGMPPYRPRETEEKPTEKYKLNLTTQTPLAVIKMMKTLFGEAAVNEQLGLAKPERVTVSEGQNVFERTPGEEYKQVISGGPKPTTGLAEYTEWKKIPGNENKTIVDYETWKSSLKPEKTPPSAGNAVDLAVKRKFGTEYLTDPVKVKEADKWLASAEGRTAVQVARDDLTPPGITYLQTSEGFTPAITKGKGIGTVGEPTGLGKATPVGEVTKLGDLGTLLSNIQTVKNLYGLDTPEEKKDWTGPAAGRVAAFKEKYLGGLPEEQVQFYAYVRDMKDALLRARSGAQINEQEYKRLVNFLPDENLPPSTFRGRLKRFDDAVNTIITNKQKALKIGGYGSQKGKAAPGAIQSGKKVIKQFVSPSTGKTKYIYDDGTEEIR